MEAQAPSLPEEYRELDSELYGELMEVPPTLFHYTDANALLSIVESQQFWASNSSYLNDATEIAFGHKALEEVVEQLQSEFPEAYRPYFFEQVAQRSLTGMARVFVLCFCAEGDDLGQWRAYGGRGRGYAIGLDMSPFLLNSLTSDGIGLSRHLIVRVRYDTLWIKDILSRLLKRSLGIFESISEPTQDQLEAAIIWTAVRAFSILIASKNPAFEGEKEWRVVITPSQQMTNKLMRFRASEALVLPYLPIQIGSAGFAPVRLPISHVIVGPIEKAAATEEAIRLFLDARGYTETVVSRSEIPLVR